MPIQVRVIRRLLNQSRFRNLKGIKAFTTDDKDKKKIIQTLATYELQGLFTNMIINSSIFPFGSNSTKVHSQLKPIAHGSPFWAFIYKNKT